jgi:hypothetical protein
VVPRWSPRSAGKACADSGRTEGSRQCRKCIRIRPAAWLLGVVGRAHSHRNRAHGAADTCGGAGLPGAPSLARRAAFLFAVTCRRFGSPGIRAALAMPVSSGCSRVAPEQTREPVTPRPRHRQVAGELGQQVILGGHRELVHHLVGHLDRRPGGRGQRAPDASRQLLWLGVPAAVNSNRAGTRWLLRPRHGTGVIAASSSLTFTLVTATPAVRSSSAESTSAGSGCHPRGAGRGLLAHSATPAGPGCRSRRQARQGRRRPGNRARAARALGPRPRRCHDDSAVWIGLQPGVRPVCSAAKASMSAYSVASIRLGLPSPCPVAASIRSRTGGSPAWSCCSSAPNL